MSSSPPLVVADRYRLIAPLGQGGMGRVWRATDVVLHREVAIKELVPPPGLTPGERQEMRERSLREARAIARLNNINVVRVFDVLSTDADPWIVMEYVASRSLQDILAQDGPFNALRTAEIGLGVLNALRAAHRNGVVHRDVKPGNVLLGTDGRVVLTDFGLATVPGDPNVTRTGLVLGSPAYIAPERARDGTAGPAADLWSLGATLYAAVEGQSPFARPSAIATLAALATENVPVARNAGPLKPVLNGLLRKDPAHRINAEEAERLLARATGRRSKMPFPMSPTMRRPGVGRERPSLPSGPGGPPVLPGSGWVAATGSAPVVPNPRPPVTGQPPVPDGRPPHYVPGKAQVSGQQPPPETPRRGRKPLDATRLDTPPVKDEIKPSSGTGQAPPTAPRGDRIRGVVPPVPAGVDVPSPVVNSAAPTNALRTGFTAADVAANRTKKAAAEHEHSLAQATSGYPVVTPRNAPAQPEVAEAQPTTVTPPAAAKPEPKPEAQATTVMPPAAVKPEPEAQAATVMPSAEPVESKPAEAETAQGKPVESKPPVENEPAESEPTADEPSEKPEPAEAEAEAPAADQPADTPGDEDTDEATGSGADAPADEPEPEAPADDAGPSTTEDKTSVVALPAQPPRPVPAPHTDEKTSLLARPAPAEEKTSLLARPAPPEEKTTLLAAAADDDKTSVVNLPPRRRRTIQVPGPDPRGSGELETEPGFTRPSRPAWTPMQMRPVERRSGGITILGTTLTRRQAVIGLGIVLTFLLLVGIILVQAFGSDTPKNPDVTKAGSGASAPAQSGGGNEGPKKTGSPAQSPTAKPSMSASSAPSAGGGIPAGWRSFKGSGYSLPVPENASNSGGGGTGTTIEWGEGRQIRIDIVSGKNDPVEYLNDDQTARGSGRIGPTRVEFHGPAADLEYLRSTGGGYQQHVVRRVFNVGDKTYVLTWYTEVDDWDAAKKDLEVIYRGFSPR